MFVAKEIKFQMRAVLTSAMLETIYKLPRDILKISCADYGDGIISGLNFFQKDNDIYISAGIIKAGKKFYFAEDDEINLSAFFNENRPVKNGKHYAIALCRLPQEFEKGVGIERLELKIIPAESVLTDANVILTLGTFQDECSGLTLPDADLKNFLDIYSFYILNVPFACRGGSTFHTYIFSAIKNILQAKSNKTFADFNFLMQLEQNGVATLEVVKTYIEANGGKKLSASADREEIFNNLLTALKAEPNVKEYFKAETAQETTFKSNDLIESHMI